MFARPAAFGGSKAFIQPGGGSVVLNENIYASFLSHFDNLSAPAVVIDVSPFAHNDFVYGNPAIVATESVFGGASLYFDGVGDFIDFDTHASLNLGSDFTIDLRWRPDSATRDSALIGVNNGAVASGANIAWGLRHMGATNAGKVQFFVYSGTTLIVNILSATALAAGTWYAIRATRKDSRVTLNINGAVEGTTTAVWANPNYNSTMALRLGTYSTGTPYLAKGYMDEVRILKNYAASDGAYTPATSAF